MFLLLRAVSNLPYELTLSPSCVLRHDEHAMRLKIKLCQKSHYSRWPHSHNSLTKNLHYANYGRHLVNMCWMGSLSHGYGAILHTLQTQQVMSRVPPRISFVYSGCTTQELHECSIGFALIKDLSKLHHLRCLHRAVYFEETSPRIASITPTIPPVDIH